MQNYNYKKDDIIRVKNEAPYFKYQCGTFQFWGGPKADVCVLDLEMGKGAHKTMACVDPKYTELIYQH